MLSPAERPPRRLVARGLIAALLVLAAIPAYLGLPLLWRPAAVRLACALIVVAGCVRVVRRVRRSIGGYAPSALDAPRPPAPAPDLDDRLLRMRDDLVFSRRSRRYYDAILWPRLCRLAGADLAPPAARRGIRRRGPSLRSLERLIAEVEKRP